MARETVLIAGQDRQLARRLSRHLQEQGCEVAFASDSVQTLITVRDQLFAAIVLDLDLPGGRGIELLQKLKTSTKTNFVPVIVLGDGADPQLPQTAKEMGAEEFIPKPVDWERLKLSLARTLGKSLDVPAEELPRGRRPKLREAGWLEKEQRRNLRIKTGDWVWVEYERGRYRLGNLSATGAFVRTEHPLTEGEKLELALVGERLLEPIKLTAVVRRSAPRQGMGLQFIRYHDAAQAQLEDLLVNLSIIRILVVDDDENIRRVLTIALEKEHYEVVAAADGAEGVQKAVECQPDLVILDLALPGLPGLEVCQRVRATPHLRHVPIVILSATTDLTDFSSAQKLGAIGFIHKPFHPRRLLNHVRMLLKR